MADFSMLRQVHVKGELSSLPAVFTDEIFECLLCRGEPQWQALGGDTERLDTQACM